jgi:hypothetical protein
MRHALMAVGLVADAAISAFFASAVPLPYIVESYE